MRHLDRVMLGLPAVLIAAIVVFAVTLFFQLRRFEQSFLAEASLTAVQEARLATYIVKPMLDAGDYAAARDFCHNFSSDYLRLTLINSSGTVEADTAGNAALFGNHASRDEVRRAMAGAPAQAVRYSDSLHRRMIYYAVPLECSRGIYVLRLALSVDQFAGVLALAGKNIFLAAGLGAAMVLLLSFYIFKRIYLPLAALQEASARVAAGELETEIPIAATGVMRELSADVCAMARQLKKQLESAESTLTELSRAEQFRRDFIANVSHEIKTPLTSIMGAAEAIAEDDELPDSVRKRLLSILAGQSKRLNLLVQDILSLAALEQKESGDPSEDFAELRLDHLLENVRNLFLPKADAAGIQLAIARTEELSMYGDCQLLEQAVGNLIANAIKYSSSPRIELSLRHDAGCAELTVRDFGVGIDPEHCARIFERFYRVHKERSRELGGTGLGLAIVKHIAQLHGGAAVLESVVGVKTEFRLMLPLVCRKAPPEADRAAAV